MRYCVFVCSVFFVASNAWAQSIAVFPSRGPEVDETVLAQISILISEQLEDLEDGQIIPVNIVAQAYDGETPAAQVTQQLGATAWLSSQVRKQSPGFNLRMRLHYVGDLSEHPTILVRHVHFTSLKDAPQYIDRALINLLRMAQNPAKTGHSKTEPRFKKAAAQKRDTLVGIKTSVQSALSPGLSIRPLTSVAFDLRFEYPRYFVEFEAGLTIPTMFENNSETYGGVFAGFGISAYLIDAPIAPYIGGGARARLLLGSFSDPATLNITPGLNFGAMFMRDRTTRVYAELNVHQNVTPMNFDGNGPSQAYFPTEVGGAFGVGW